MTIMEADWVSPPGVRAGTVMRGGSAAELPATAPRLQQVHGARVVTLGSNDFADGVPEADGVYGNRPRDLCVIRTADCLPVLLASADGREIAAVHAGWRGLAAGVVEAAVARFAAPPDSIRAWLGPAISQPAFEVGDDVFAAFEPWSRDCPGFFLRNERGRYQADLFGLARARLAGVGVTDVAGGGHCTVADTAGCYSFRRDGATGRLLTFVYREP